MFDELCVLDTLFIFLSKWGRKEQKGLFVILINGNDDNLFYTSPFTKEPRTLYINSRG